RHGELARDRGKGGIAPHLIGKMLESDGAELEREPDQIRKAELRAGEVVPSGLGVLGGDAIGRNIDALDIVASEVLVIEQTDERLDRGLDVQSVMPKGTAGGSAMARALSVRAKACMKPSRASITPGGPSTPCSASSADCRPSRAAWPACSRLMSPPPLTKANKPPALEAARPRALVRRSAESPASLPAAAAEPNTPTAAVG